MTLQHNHFNPHWPISKEKPTVTRKKRTDLDGVLVGRVITFSPPLIYYLYSDGPGQCHTRVVECRQCIRTYATVQKLAKTYSACLINIWVNTSQPRWYFLQFKDEFGPDRLLIPALPWSVYTGWEKWLDGT